MLISLNGETAVEISMHDSEGIAVIKMTYKKTNPLDINFMAGLYDCLTSLFNDEKVKVLVLSSGLRFAFCSGLDLPGALKFSEVDLISGFLVQQYERFFELLKLIVCSPKPIIAAINGVTIGVGVLLSVACDYQICSELAWFQIPEMVIGGVFPVSLLMAQIGKKNTQNMIFHNEKINADDAQNMGLIDTVTKHKDVGQEALNLAVRLAQVDRVCLESQRRLIREQTVNLMVNENEKMPLYLKQLSGRESLVSNLRGLKDANR